MTGLSHDRKDAPKGRAIRRSSGDAQRALRQLSFGWFAEGETGAYVVCPDCRERVSRPWSPLDHFAPRSPWHVDALTTALAEHLADHKTEVQR